MFPLLTGLNVNSAQCVDIDVQVQQLSKDILMDTGKTSDYRVSFKSLI